MYISCAAQPLNTNLIKEKDGKIGIGTANPDALLTVKGTIHTQEVLVDLQGAVAPDYVFQKFYTGASILNPLYQFMDLQSLEVYLKKNHHLPKIPSAETLNNEGMALKEMSLLLLEKVEELTLHTINQQKEIDQLKKELLRLKNEH